MQFLTDWIRCHWLLALSKRWTKSFSQCEMFSCCTLLQLTSSEKWRTSTSSRLGTLHTLSCPTPINIHNPPFSSWNKTYRYKCWCSWIWFEFSRLNIELECGFGRLVGFSRRLFTLCCSRLVSGLFRSSVLFGAGCCLMLLCFLFFLGSAVLLISWWWLFIGYWWCWFLASWKKRNNVCRYWTLEPECLVKLNQIIEFLLLDRLLLCMKLIFLLYGKCTKCVGDFSFDMFGLSICRFL